MSWAEIKKAVNSDLSTPLNEQLGLTLVNMYKDKNGTQYAQTKSYTVSNTNGVVIVTNETTGNDYIRLYIDGSANTNGQVNGGQMICVVDKNHTYKFETSLSSSKAWVVAIYSFGGGID